MGDILVIDLLGGLGDLLLILPAVHALAAAHPDARLHVLTHEPGAQLLRTDPAVHTVRTSGPDAAAAVATALAELRPDIVVSTTRHSGIPELVAATGCRAVTDLWRSPPPDQRVDERYLHILRTEGLIGTGPAPGDVVLTAPEHEAGARAVAATLGDRTARPVALLPNAGMAVKQWPYWAELATALAERHVPILSCAEGGTDLPGALPPVDLRELAAYFGEIGRRGGVVVGADTGPLRLAAAMGSRAIGLFGPTVRERYGLPAGAVNLQGLPGCPHRRPLAITEQCCWWTAVCPLRDAGPACMADISVETVLAHLNSTSVA
jgi:ADP-heptose:LPS heptosyltransferase